MDSSSSSDNSDKLAANAHRTQIGDGSAKQAVNAHRAQMSDDSTTDSTDMTGGRSRRRSRPVDRRAHRRFPGRSAAPRTQLR